MSTRVNSRCGLFMGMACPPRLSALNRQDADPVGMADLAPEHRILELELELPGRAHAATSRECSAEHQGAIAEPTAARIVGDERTGVEQRTHGALLVDDPLAGFDDVSA